MGIANVPDTFDSAIAFLIAQGAPPRLVQHGRIVGEVASDLSRSLLGIGILHDTTLVTVGAVLHDSGKIVCPSELAGPGNLHEAAGRELLLAVGLPASLADMCVAHGNWTSESTLEQLLVAAADHLWRGKRTADLEELLIGKCAETAGVEVWAMMLQIDPIFERIAADGEDRLASCAGI